MTTHILSLTYAPKIPLVKSGECTQTIRLHNPERPKKVGDKLILHTWAGKPYRSKWDWRLETEILALALLDWGRSIEDAQILTQTNGVWGAYESISEAELGVIAELDGIEPNWMHLAETLMKLNGLKKIALTEWDIIRWLKPTIRRVE